MDDLKNDNTNVIRGNLIFSLKYADKTASLIGLHGYSQIIFIPRSIIHNDEEYIITKLSKGSIKSTGGTHTIQFPPDSELRTIEKDSISDEWIMSITIPPSVCEIQRGWCKNANKLKYVNIMPNNKHFKQYGNVFVLGKSDINSNEFDVIVFAKKDTRTITIPPNIKIIFSYAFSRSSIESVFIPSNVIQLCKGCFSFCYNLSKVEFAPDSQLKIIEKCAFDYSKIEYLSIPSSVCELQDGWCKRTRYLKFVNVSPNNQRFTNYKDEFVFGKTDINRDEYDILVFANKNIQTVKIPPNIRVISPYAFSHSLIEKVFIQSNVTIIGKGCFSFCNNLSKVEFAPDSQLQIIEPYAFSYTDINNISIPIHVKKISESSFFFCQDLRHVEIMSNSELQIIEKNAFYFTLIESILIPSNVCELKDGWCSGTQHLSKVSIMPNNKNYINLDDKMIIGKSDANKEQYDVLMFVCRNLKKITIPSFIKYIAAYAFSFSQIESIVISSHITSIGDSAFANCTKLRHLEIPSDSELQKIGEKAFAFNKIKSIVILSQIKHICDDSFFMCREIKLIEIAHNSVLNSIKTVQFDDNNLIVMLPTAK